MKRGASIMTEERARHYAKALARGMGITFYVVRSRQGRFLAVQIPSDDCEILATVAPPRAWPPAIPRRTDQKGCLASAQQAALLVKFLPPPADLRRPSSPGLPQ